MKLGNVVASEYDQSDVRENACSLENVIQAKCECGKCKMKNEKVLSKIHVEIGPMVLRSQVPKC